MIDIISLLSNDGYIMCNKTIIKLFGTDCAIILGELCAEYNYYKDRGQLQEDNFFYSTQSNIEYNTGLSEHNQRKAINTLKSNNILEVVKKGLPAKNYFRINTQELLNIFTTSENNSSLNFKPQVTENLNLNNNTQTKIKDNNSKELLERSSGKHSTLFSVPVKTKQPEVIEDVKPKRKSLYVKCLDMINKFTTDATTVNLLKQYLEIRLSMKDKPIYANQWQGLLNKLDKLGSTEKEIQQIISQSIEWSYASFFEYNPNIGKGSGKSNWHNDDANKDVKSVTMSEEELKQFEDDIERRKQEGERVVY